MGSYSKAYPFGIPASVILGLVERWEPLPDRPESAPPLFRYDDHPECPGVRGMTHPRCYLVLVDNSEEGARAIGMRKPSDWVTPKVTEQAALEEGK